MSDPLARLYMESPTGDNLESVFRWIHSLGEARDQQGVDFNRLADWVGALYDYDTPRESFTPTTYPTFYDWFLRRLTPETRVAARYRAATATICSPAEALFRYGGRVGDGRIQLKEGSADVLRALQEREPDVGDFPFIRLGLRKCHYHHVHSPVDGVIVGIEDFERGTGAFGNNTVTLVHLSTNVGPVFLCAIGEHTVQNFHRVVREGDTLRKVDEVGWFWWGSMVLLVYPPGLTPASPLTKLFIGDPVASATR